MFTWYSSLATPEVASVPVRPSSTGPSYVPPGPGVPGLSNAALVGATWSSLSATDFVASTLPFLSTERYSIV